MSKKVKLLNKEKDIVSQMKTFCPISEFNLFDEILFSKEKKKYTPREYDRLIAIKKRLFIEKENKTGTYKGQSATFLKNKYLYWTHEGVLEYLWANEKVKNDEMMEQANELETDYLKICLEKYISDKKISLNDVDLISLGCGDGLKDIAIIKNNGLNINNNYFLIDISPFLLLKAINNFSIQRSDLLNNIYPILIDFFDLNKLSSKTNEQILDPKRKRIFLLLGQTFANYREAELLFEISKFMQEDDLLIIGAELINNRASDTIASKYDNEENNNFLLRPLRMIPWFSKFDEDRFNFSTNTGAHNVLSMIDKTIIYTANIKIPYIDYEAVIGWTSKYEYVELNKFLHSLKFLTPKINLDLYHQRITNDGYYGLFTLVKNSLKKNTKSLPDHNPEDF